MAAVVVILLWGLLIVQAISTDKQPWQPAETPFYAGSKVLTGNTSNPLALGNKMAMRADSGGGGFDFKKTISKPQPPHPPMSAARNPTPAYVKPRAPHPPETAARNPAPALPSGGAQKSRVNTGSSSGISSGGTGVYGATTFAGGGGGGVGGGGQSQDQYLAQDAEFLDEKSAAQQEYDNLVAQLAQQGTEYNTNNQNTLRNLGWQGDEGGWNQQDKLTGYGNAYQNQLNDFAGRGMLDSSLYGEAQNDLNRGFEQQRTDLGTALQQFMNQQTLQKTSATQGRDRAVADAQRQAIARYAAQYGLTGA
jgi:hypothetical protein